MGKVPHGLLNANRGEQFVCLNDSSSPRSASVCPSRPRLPAVCNVEVGWMISVVVGGGTRPRRWWHTHWFGSASSWLSVRVDSFTTEDILNSTEHRALVYPKLIDIECVTCLNCTKFDKALPWVLSNTPTECEVDRLSCSRDMRRTHRTTKRQVACFTVR